MQQDSEGEKAVRAALRIYEESINTKVGADFLWAPHHRITRANRSKLAREIAALVQQNIPDRKRSVQLTWRNFSGDLMSTVDSIWVDRLIDYKANFWRCSGGGSVPDWDADTLQSEINRKNAKPKDYRTAFDEIWLVIVSPFDVPSGWMEMTETVEAHQFRTTFHRLFLLSSFPFKVFPLRRLPAQRE